MDRHLVWDGIPQHRKTPNRQLVKHEVRRVKIKHWDLVPTAAYTPVRFFSLLSMLYKRRFLPVR